MEIEDNEQEILLEQENVSVGGGAVNSVNGQVGDVVLTTSDLENTSDYQTGSEVESAINTAVATETTNREAADTALQTAITNEATTRANADTNLQSQIDAISASSDVTDIVGTYAELQSYDTSTLGDNDIIKVLQDESRNGETTYYRWSTTTQSFTLIGEEGPYYTKSQADALLNAKQNTLTAGNGIDITNDVISATGGGGPTVVQTTGTSATDVMSQIAVTSMVFADPAIKRSVRIGSTRDTGAYSLNIGYSSGSSSGEVSGTHSVGVGDDATIRNGSDYSVAIGSNSQIGIYMDGTVALGAYSGSNINAAGIMDIGSSRTTYGYDNSNYRLLTGVHDPVGDHDAANKEYVDTLIAALEARIAALEGN